MKMSICVSDPPQIVSVGPDRLTTSPLFSSASFTCVAEGNPPPGVQWLQRVATPGGEVLLRGSLPTLDIANVTYDFQGEYVCKATNVIGGAERTVQSEPIALQVVGQFYHYTFSYILFHVSSFNTSYVYYTMNGSSSCYQFHALAYVM